MNQKQLILRLINYFSELQQLLQQGETRVRSRYLAKKLGVTPALVRKDFSMFHITGNRRGGYTITETLQAISDILDKERAHKAIIAGAGNIGRALLRYKGFENENIEIVAMFDTDDKKIAPDADIPILPAETMHSYIQSQKIEVAIIAVPATNAQTVFTTMVDAGIKGITNFAPVHLNHSDSCIVNNINLAQEMAALIYFAGKNNTQK